MAQATQPGKPLPEEDLERFDPLAATNRSLNYDFIVELFPGTWKVIRKSDRFEFLAHEETRRLQDNAGSLTPLAHMLDPNGWDLMSAVMRIFNHENLINFVDWIQVQTTENGQLRGLPPRHFIIWDFCNAGILENLFMVERKTPKSELHADQELRKAQDDPTYKQAVEEAHLQPSAFLPEAFCWHVLCSVLNALAWLHDGLREEWDCDQNAWVLKRADVDWQTILHRNISPDNIFFCHPQTKFETYGLCKLGNFGNSFVSGVFNGIGVVQAIAPPARWQRVLAPQQGISPNLEEIRRRDAAIEDPPHPPTQDQPYTITSEYRALADVIVAMMVKPADPDEANNHWQKLRSLDAHDWQAAIAHTTYTKVLKNFVAELMSATERPFKYDPSRRPIDRAQRTFLMYKKAKSLQQKFRTLKNEGKDVVTTTHLQIEQGKLDRKAAEEHADNEQHKQDVLEYLQNSNRFAGSDDPPTSMDDLLDEIDEVCDEVNNDTYDTHPRPGMVY
ncbi:hypothetical protein SCAR479_10450 [Seiridium cardinale]|uniref:Protein kinase domain-containing protein n=1 Tax=Seiridium cardinale TaxID=138064 RepID=A0ABR2XGY7_9PEZI